MQAQVSQIRVTIPAPLQTQLLEKSKSLGLSVSAYVKYLIIDDVRETKYPVRKMSESSEKAYLQAKEEEKNGTLIEIKDIDEYFDNL